MVHRLGRSLMPVAVAALVMTLALSVPQAGAAFPGTNGVIAFSRNHEICVVHPDGSSMQNLTRTVANETDPAFSPGGDAIAFIRLNSDLAGDVVIMGADGSTPLVTAPGSYSHPAFSPDGTQLVVARHGPEAGLYVMRTDGTGSRRLTQSPGDDDLAPAWSPDGSTIVFARDTSSGREIFTIASDGTDERRLTDNDVPDSGPSWSPDGEQIVFARDGDIYRMSPDGSNVFRLTADPVATPGAVPPPRHLRSDPVYSPDGARIAFVRDGEIWMLDPTSGGTETRLTERIGGISDLAPDWQALPPPSRRPQPARTAGSSSPPPDAEPTDERCRPSTATPSPSPSPGDGSTGRAASTVTIRYDGVSFQGRVSSEHPACVGGRKVLLRRERKSQPPVTEGRDRSSSRGRWKIRKPDADGRYHGRVTRKTISAGGDEIVCRKSRSEEVVEVIGVQPSGD